MAAAMERKKMSIFVYFYVFLALFGYISCINQRYIVDYKSKSECKNSPTAATHEYFDLSDLKCNPCAQERTFQTQSPDGLGCICQPGYYLTENYGGGKITCAKCPDNQMTSEDGWGCVACAAASPFNAATKQCQSCVDLQIGVESYRNGQEFPTKDQTAERTCQACNAKTAPDSSGSQCTRCSQILSMLPAAAECKCTSLTGGLCFPADAYLPDDTNSLFTVQSNDEKESVVSAYFKDHIRAAIGICNPAVYGNLTACQLLGNLCTLIYNNMENIGRSGAGDACSQYDYLKTLSGAGNDCYIGSQFRGLQKQKITDEVVLLKTVAGTLESALEVLKPSTQPHVVTSSRTDTGVHALCNTVHVDLEPQESAQTSEYCPKIMGHVLNCYMKKNDHDIRIRKILRVNDDFHARFNAIGRSYCYKMAKLHKDCEDILDHPVAPLSATDLRRCSVIPSNCDMELFKEGAAILSGRHNFQAFSKLVKPHQNPVKMMQLSVLPSVSAMDNLLDDESRILEHFDVLITGDSFLYKQVRKMMGALVSYGTGRICTDTLRDMLVNPSKYQNNNKLIPCLQPSGLYLAKVHYLPEDLVYDPSRPVRERPGLNQPCENDDDIS